MLFTLEISTDYGWRLVPVRPFREYDLLGMGQGLLRRREENSACPENALCSEKSLQP